MHTAALNTQNRTQRITRRLRLVKTSPVKLPKVILVCDSAMKTRHWLSALMIEESEALCVSNVLELNFNDLARLAVIDVALEQLAETLKVLRGSYAQSDLQILVAADHLTDELQLAGVMPRYRAMPCGQRELIQLARRLLMGTNSLSRGDMRQREMML